MEKEIYTSEVKVGKPVPDYTFEVYHAAEIKKISLSNLRGKWAVLVFYPADFSTVCPTELKEFAQRYPEFEEAQAEIISFSTDSTHDHSAWHESDEGLKQITYPMAADPSGKISRAFGVLIENSGNDLVIDEGLALRGTFIIDPDGILRSSEISDTSVGRSAAETLRKLQALQFVASHNGQVCPASWEPGMDTLMPKV